MSTVAPPALRNVYTLIDPYLAYEQRSGIVNAGSPGYHTSREDLLRQGRTSDYSIQCPADRRGEPSFAAGIDIGFTRLSEQVTVHKRLRTACTPVAGTETDPRIECLREFIGTLDGKNVSGYNRVATGSASRSRVGWVASGFSDSSHLTHEHLSVLRDRANNDNDMRGLAEVICGLGRGALGWQGPGSTAVEWVWDGASFPGAGRFGDGQSGPWITWLGKRLVAHGWTGYQVGPGPDWGPADKAGVIWAQQRQGFTGADADGIPGPTTWAWLAADPVSEPAPVEYPTPAKREVYLDRLREGVTDSDSVWWVQSALTRRKLYHGVLTGSYDPATMTAARAYQTTLGDAPQYVDGILGEKQTIRLFADAQMPVTIYRSSKTGGQIYPAVGEETPVTAFVIPTTAWTGRAGRTLIQGLLIHPRSGVRVVHQADTVAGQNEQDTVFRFHAPDNTYLGSVTVQRAGHGSTCGIEPTGQHTMRLWLGHELLGCLGYIAVDLSSGKPVASSFVRVPGIPRGNPSIDADNDLLCLRTLADKAKGINRFRGYKLSDVRAGKAPKPLWDCTVPAWGKRFQGHLIVGGRLYVHRDVETTTSKVVGQSRVHVYSTAGKLLDVRDTTKLGDEAQGCCVVDGQPCIVKRTGPDTAKRVVQVTPWALVPAGVAV